jgi:phosphogluconate dehydratase
MLGPPAVRALPDIIRRRRARSAATAQFAGGVPAMCDGVTQGRPGMELSLFSRDVIAMATGVALTHDAFDGALMLGVCDKIVPGLFIGALAFGHLPAVFAPAGPMPSGIPNAEKARVRAEYAEGKVGRDPAGGEVGSYHSARHLHLLRHRQLQPDDDGAGGCTCPAPPSSIRTPACATP